MSSESFIFLEWILRSFSGASLWASDRDETVESSRAKKSQVKNIGPVRSRDNPYISPGIKPSISERSCIRVALDFPVTRCSWIKSFLAPMESSSSMNMMLGIFFCHFERGPSQALRLRRYISGQVRAHYPDKCRFCLACNGFCQERFTSFPERHTIICLWEALFLFVQTLQVFVSGSSTVSRSSRICSSRPRYPNMKCSGILWPPSHVRRGRARKEGYQQQQDSGNLKKQKHPAQVGNCWWTGSIHNDWGPVLLLIITLPLSEHPLLCLRQGEVL